VTNLGGFAKDWNFDIFSNMPFFTLHIHVVYFLKVQNQFALLKDLVFEMYFSNFDL
jgi:hypothetical protein